jgi:hypothetical protein
MISRLITFGGLVVCCWFSAITQLSGAPSGLYGTVQRANAKVVPNACVVLVEEASGFPLDLTLKDDRRIAVAKADERGRFQMKLRSFSEAKLMLAVLGEPVVKRAGGTKEVIGTDVAIRNVNLTGTNMIVVPNNFRPSGKTPSGAK